MRTPRAMVMLDAMSSENESEREQSDDRQSGTDWSEKEDRAGATASRDLADGLELMMRAARKAVRDIDRSKLEELGRRARRNLDSLDRKRVEELGRKAARRLDPRRIEEVAEEAGRELLGVVERVTERVEGMVSGVARRSKPPPGDNDSGGDGESDDEAGRTRVRVEDD